MNKKLLVVVEGPTGTGKTEIGIQLATYFNSEIISADSRQIFKELSIGTAKPSKEQRLKITHHFVDFVSIHEMYNAFMFEEQVNAFLDSYFLSNDIAFMVGGSGMYINAVINGIDLIPDIDSEIRQSVSNDFQLRGIKYLQKELQQIDPEYYKIVDINNQARLIRAIEVYKQTGKPYSSFRTKQLKQRSYQVVKIAIDRERDDLYDRINLRVDEMVHEGLEAEAFKWNGYRYLNALQTVGYKEFFAYFDGLMTKKDAINLIKQNTRHYAKKQVTWFKKDVNTSWILYNEVDEMIRVINKELNGI